MHIVGLFCEMKNAGWLTGLFQITYYRLSVIWFRLAALNVKVTGLVHTT